MLKSIITTLVSIEGGGECTLGHLTKYLLRVYQMTLKKNKIDNLDFNNVEPQNKRVIILFGLIQGTLSQMVHYISYLGTLWECNSSLLNRVYCFSLEIHLCI